MSDCPICPMLATDRDDALGEAEALRSHLAQMLPLAMDLAEDLELWAADDDLPHHRRNQARQRAAQLRTAIAS